MTVAIPYPSLTHCNDSDCPDLRDPALIMIAPQAIHIARPERSNPTRRYASISAASQMRLNGLLRWQESYWTDNGLITFAIGVPLGFVGIELCLD